jgi:hypothetical protein
LKCFNIFQQSLLSSLIHHIKKSLWTIWSVHNRIIYSSSLRVQQANKPKWIYYLITKAFQHFHAQLISRIIKHHSIQTQVVVCNRPLKNIYHTIERSSDSSIISFRAKAAEKCKLNPFSLFICCDLFVEASIGKKCYTIGSVAICHEQFKEKIELDTSFNAF